MKLPSIALLLALPLSSHAATECFTVYDEQNVAIYSSTKSPVDLSQTISVAMAKKFPGGHLVWTKLDDRSCPEFDERSQRVAGRPGDPSRTRAESSVFSSAPEIGTRSAAPFDATPRK